MHPAFSILLVLVQIIAGTIALFVYTIAAFGFAYVIGHATVSEGVRGWLYRRGRELDGRCNAEVTANIGAGAHVHDDRCYIVRQPPIVLQLIECPACLGWWVGLVIGVIIIGVQYEAPTRFIVIGAFVLAFYTAGSNFILAKLSRLID